MSNSDQTQSTQETTSTETSPTENLRLDVGGRNIISSSGWKSYLIGGATAFVVGFGVFALVKNIPDVNIPLLNFQRSLSVETE